MPSPLIRRATATDALALARLRFEFRSAQAEAVEEEATFIPRCTEWMREHLSADHHWLCWAAESDNGLYGMCWLHLIEKLPNPAAETEWHGYITSVYVQPAMRSSGTGSTLLRAALRECEARRVDAIVLWPTPRSRSLYARHGFAAPADLLQRRLHGAIDTAEHR